MKGKHRLTVAIGERLQPVGTLIFEAKDFRQISAFRYYDEWISDAKAFALAPKMSLDSQWRHWSTRGRSIFRSPLPGPIADSTPDAWGRSLLTHAFGRPPTELEFLLSVNDFTRVGALRYFLENSESARNVGFPTPQLAQLSELRELVFRFESGKGDLQRIARKLCGSADSLGGARPKADFDDDGVLSIAKFTSSRDSMPVEKMEVATLNLAARTGIRCVSARLEFADSEFPVSIIRRFDRQNGKRHYYISGYSFLQADESDGLWYYTDLVDAMRCNCASAESFYRETKELFKRALFNILVCNTDNHLRNLGFIHSEIGGWMLAPAFDLNPQPFRDHRLKTGISPLSGLTPSVSAAIEAAPFFEIQQNEATELANQMAVQISDEWEDCCREAGMAKPEIDQYRAAFEHEEMRCALRLVAPSRRKPKTAHERNSASNFLKS